MKKILIGLGTLALILTIMSPLATAEAYRGDHSVQGPNYSPERHEAMTNVFETKDYDAWVKLMDGKGRITQVINKDNFAKFAEAHLLAKQGKIEESKTIMKELGLGLGRGQGLGNRCGGANR